MKYFVDAIVARSRLEELSRRRPEIADVKIEAPLVITGVGRSGTNNLCNLISAY